MTAQANQPAKFLVPFAQNDSSRVEIPVTTTDATRASQSTGFPPLTMQPPEAGGVPPQGEDFNGAMNQVARIAWWLMLGGEFAFDSAFATATQIGGYPKGAVLQSADALGNWISTADSNTANPDTSTDPGGGGYVPGYQYGTTALSGLTGGTVTLTNAQAAKCRITLSGALTSALTIIVPNWLYDWTFINNTTGAFAVTVKTLAGTGASIPQNSKRWPVYGDGANVNAAYPPGTLVNVQVFSTAGSFTYNKTPGASDVIVEGVAGGGAGGGALATTSSQMSAGGGGGGGAYGRVRITNIPSSVGGQVGAGGVSAAGAAGGNGGTTSFGTYLTLGGGLGGQSSAVATAQLIGGPGGGAVAIAFGSGTQPIEQGQGGGGDYSTCLGASTSTVVGGKGGASHYGGGGNAVGGGAPGNASSSYGGGGSGTANGGTGGLLAGGSGAVGLVVVYEFS